MAGVYLGTSGFSYREWVGRFYPSGIKPAGMLAYYAGHFQAVELNNTFYQLPSEDNIQTWRESVPPGFRFAVKASQRITHRRDFGMADGFFTFFLSRIHGLGERLGPILFQFPPYFEDAEAVLAFIRQMQEWIPRRVPATPVVEVRNRRLLQPEFFRQLAAVRVNLGINDEYLGRSEWPDPVDIAYLRLRREDYAPEDLRALAVQLQSWSARGKTCYVFFKHEARAPELARNLARWFGGAGNAPHAPSPMGPRRAPD